MEEDVVELPRRALRWGPIWGGLFVVGAVQILMQLFGMAIGVSVLQPTPGAVEGVSIWAGIWAVISTWTAFFCGGWFASSAEERPLRRAEAIRSGLAVWSFALTIGIFLTTAGLIGAVDLARALMLPPGARAAVHSGYTIGAAWATFGTVLLSIAASLGGALVGLRVTTQRARRPIVRTTTTVPSPTVS